MIENEIKRKSGLNLETKLTIGLSILSIAISIVKIYNIVKNEQD